LLNALRPGGSLLLIDFVRTDRRWQRALIQVMIWFFRLTANLETRQLLDWQSIVAETRLSRAGQRPQVWGMVSAEWWH